MSLRKRARALWRWVPAHPFSPALHAEQLADLLDQRAEGQQRPLAPAPRRRQGQEPTPLRQQHLEPAHRRQHATALCVVWAGGGLGDAVMPPQGICAYYHQEGSLNEKLAQNNKCAEQRGEYPDTRSFKSGEGLAGHLPRPAELHIPLFAAPWGSTFRGTRSGSRGGSAGRRPVWWGGGRGNPPQYHAECPSRACFLAH